MFRDMRALPAHQQTDLERQSTDWMRGALTRGEYLAWVAEVAPDLGGRLLVRLKDAARTELQVARERARAFRERLVL